MEWKTWIVIFCIGIALYVLVKWQRGLIKHDGELLGYSALLLELLGLSLTVYWAINATEGTILPIVFCVGFLGMIVGRAVLIPQIIKMEKIIAKSFIILGLGVAYLALYSSGLFYAVNDAGYSAQERFESSAPAKALDSEIEIVKQRISSLATFADAGKAHTEQQAIQQARNEHYARVNELETKLAQKRAELASCPHNYITNCIKPAKSAIVRLESELSGLDGVSVGSGYAQKHDEYNSLQAHLVELQNKRASLSQNGQGIKSMWKPEDTMLAGLFGISEEKANQIKWFIFTFIFDFLSLVFRIVSVFITPVVIIPPAKVRFATGVPALLVGGRIESDGLIEAHAGECVLNATATNWMDTHYPDLLDDINRGEFFNYEQGSNRQGTLEEQGSNRQGWTVEGLVDHITSQFTKTTWTIRELMSTFNIGSDKATKVKALMQKTGDKQHEV